MGTEQIELKMKEDEELFFSRQWNRSFLNHIEGVITATPVSFDLIIKIQNTMHRINMSLKVAVNDTDDTKYICKYALKANGLLWKDGYVIDEPYLRNLMKEVMRMRPNLCEYDLTKAIMEE